MSGMKPQSGTGLIFKITGIITLSCINVKETLKIDLNSPCFDVIARLAWVIIFLVVIVFALAGTVKTVNLHSVVDKFFLLQILHGYSFQWLLPHVLHPSVSPVVCFEGIFFREQEAFPMPNG